MPLSSNPYKVQQARRYASHFTNPTAQEFARHFCEWLIGTRKTCPNRPGGLPLAVAGRIRTTLWRKLSARKGTP